MIIIDIMDKDDINWYFDYNIQSRKKIIEKNNKVILAFKKKETTIKPEEKIRFLSNKIEFFEYNDEKEILELIKYNPSTIINTFYEKYINISNKLKKELWQKTTKDSNIFLNKYLQRHTIWKKFPETITKHIKIEKESDLKQLSELNYPLFLKPFWWLTSIWTRKIHNKDELMEQIPQTLSILEKLNQNWNFEENWLLLEEFIEWELFAMSYFVDEKQEIHINKVMKQRDNLWWTHTHLICWLVSEEANSEINLEKFKEFAKKTVIWWNIKNTFICHQFKKTPNGELKTIELNWRIGWFNVELYNFTYGMNFFEIYTDWKFKTTESWSSAGFFRIYPKQKQKFNWYNMDLFRKINNLASKQRRYLLKVKEEFVWTPSDGSEYYWTLVLHHPDKEQFQKDFNFVRENYYNIFL